MKTLGLKTRYLLFPAICALCGASWLVGFASPDVLSSAHSQRKQYPVEDAALKSLSNAPDNAKRTIDPPADYRDAIRLLKAHHYTATLDPAQIRLLTYEAIRGMVASLDDPFSSFLDPDDWTQMQATTRGDFEGVGIILQSDNGRVRVAEVVETSPAEKAGVKSGDTIAKVNGQAVTGQSMNEIVRRIKGNPGTKVKVGIWRGATPLEFSLLRTNVVPPIVKYEIVDAQARIARIALTEFNERSIEQLFAAFDAVKKQGARAIIFDLRGNPGGLLDVSIDVASVFIRRDSRPEFQNAVVFVKEGSGDEAKRVLRSDYYRMDKMPLTVLVNGGSASAAEIVTAAIQDYGAGTIVGERTYGKGKVQTLFPLDDTSALRLTTGLYYSPKHTDINYRHDAAGRRIADTGGVLPDVAVTQPPNWGGWSDHKNDAQLQHGIELLQTKLNNADTAR